MRDIPKLEPENIIRVLIADDHPVTRSGLVFLLERQPYIDIVGFAGDGDEALKQVETLAPELLILDLVLPKTSGLLVLDAIAAKKLRPLVLVISGQGTGLDFERARQLGAQGLISKEDEPLAILEGIRALQAGGRYISPVVGTMLASFGEGAQSSAGASAGSTQMLTPREREILGLIAEGLSNQSIGDHLGISIATVKKHREHIRDKSGAANAVELTHLAVRLGLKKV